MKTKNQIRNEYINKRKVLLPKYLKKSNKKISKATIAFIKNNKFSSIGIYINNDFEIDTSKIMKYCFKNNINVYLPNCDFKKTEMIFKKINNLTTDIEYNDRLNIFQAKNECETLVNYNILDAIFLPVVIFDKNLSRVGMGKGYYDRWFNKHKFKGLKIGLSQHSQFSNEKIQMESHDVGMDFCITEKEIYQIEY